MSPFSTTNNINIDTILGISVPYMDYCGEINSLLSLRSGLLELYIGTRNIEHKIASQYPNQKISISGPSLYPDLTQHESNLVVCFFHWFSTSLHNYLRLTAVIIFKSEHIEKVANVDEYILNYDKIKKVCDSYIDKIGDVSEVTKWRHKVGAHFAYTAPRSDDNPATLAVSAFSLIGFYNDRLSTCGSTITTHGHEANIPIWSLTDIFEKIQPRFFPEFESIVEEYKQKQQPIR